MTSSSGKRAVVTTKNASTAGSRWACADTKQARQGATTTAANQLNAVACRSAKDCLAVGASYAKDTPLPETWNGRTWTRLPVRLPAGVSLALLNGVACPAASGTFCMAVGTMTKGSTVSAVADLWNGRVWTPYSPPSAALTRLDAISCLSPKFCVAVGTSGSRGLGGGVAETWNGTKWTMKALPVPKNSSVFVSGASCASTRFCVAGSAAFVGNAPEAAFLESWNGRTWAIMKLAQPHGVVQPGIYSLSCPAAKYCLAVGGGGNVAGFNSFTEKWNGSAWSQTTSVPWPRGTMNTWLYSVSCVAVGRCIAAGVLDLNPASNGSLSGRAGAASWNGRAWTAIPVPAPVSGHTSLFSGIACLPGSSQFCAAVGLSGLVNTTVSSGLAGLWNGKSWKLIGV